MKWISCLLLLFVLAGCTKFPDIGDGYILDYNAGGDIGIINNDNTYVIYGHILEYSFNEDYIIAAERPREVVPECTGTIKGNKKKDCDRAFEGGTFVQFYIIDKKKDVPLVH